MNKESKTKYIEKMFKKRFEGTFAGTWKDFADEVNKHIGETRTGRSYSASYRRWLKEIDRVSATATRDEDEALQHDSIYEEKLLQLKKEKVQVRKEKNELNKLFNNLAEKENRLEKVEDIIKKNIKPSTIKIPAVKKGKTQSSALLLLADIHFGKEFKIYDFEHNLMNEYNEEVCYSRLAQVLEETKRICKEKNLKEITIFNLGDIIEGDLRPQTRYKLRLSAPEQTVRIANYLAKWIEELSKYVKIEYQQTSGNHGDLRFDYDKTGQDPDNNLEPIIMNTIEAYNKNNPNVKCVWNKTGKCFKNIQGFNVLGIHGEVAKLEKAIGDLSVFYDKPVHFLMAGHKHNQHYKNTGRHRGFIGAGSLVGIDTYSKKLIKHSDPNSTLVVITKDKGITETHTIITN